MSVIQEPERSKIYTRIKHLLGAPLRSVEVTDEMMDSLMELSIQDYEQYVLNWLIDSQWVNLVNLNMTEKSVAKALITRTMDFEQQFSYSYSKIVGLQAEGPWVLKKDYIVLEQNKQNYEIPAGREINEVLWFSNQPWTAFGLGGIGGFGGVGLGGGGGAGAASTTGTSVTSGCGAAFSRRRGRSFLSAAAGFIARIFGINSDLASFLAFLIPRPSAISLNSESNLPLSSSVVYMRGQVE